MHFYAPFCFLLLVEYQADGFVLMDVARKSLLYSEMTTTSARLSTTIPPPGPKVVMKLFNMEKRHCLDSKKLLTISCLQTKTSTHISDGSSTMYGTIIFQLTRLNYLNMRYQGSSTISLKITVTISTMTPIFQDRPT